MTVRSDEYVLKSSMQEALEAWHAVHPRPKENTLITSQQLVKILEIPEQRADVWCPHIDAALIEFDINTPLRLAHFLAQVGHESGGFKYVKEIWTNSPAQQSYEGAARLGNTEPGDGEKFMGRGPMQLTGRKNYKLCGAFIGVDLVAQPQLVERIDVGARSAGWFWAIGAGFNLGHAALVALKTRGMGNGVNLNDLADMDRIDLITLCVNGGTSGFEQRSAILMRAINVLGVNVQAGESATWSRA